MDKTTTKNDTEIPEALLKGIVTYKLFYSTDLIGLLGKDLFSYISNSLNISIYNFFVHPRNECFMSCLRNTLGVSLDSIFISQDINPSNIPYDIDVAINGNCLVVLVSSVDSSNIKDFGLRYFVKNATLELNQNIYFH